MVKRLFERSLFSSEPRGGFIGQFVKHRVPVLFGGMSDPFQPAEVKHRVSARMLDIFRTHEYPVVISTKSNLVSDPAYLSLLQELRFLVVQFSFSTTRDDVAALLEPNCYPPSQLLHAMERLSKAGVTVTCRWQPYIPGVSEAPNEFVRRLASTGCKHIAFEHLKTPVERYDHLWLTLVSRTGIDFNQHYKALGAKRDGREFVLPPKAKRATILEVRRLTHKYKMTFGAADNDFQYLSDGNCCCSGVDLFPGFQNWFKHQIAYAVKKAPTSEIKYGLISDEWCPEGSVDRYLNSRSRLSARSSSEGSIREHILQRWNDPKSPHSPAAFYGVVPTNRRTESGNLIYMRSIDTK